MEGMFGLLVVLFVVSFLVSTAKKNAAKAKRAAEEARNKPPTPLHFTTNMVMERHGGSPDPTGIPPHEPSRPAVQTTLRTPEHDDYVGSLGTLSTEGMDPCHEEQAEAMAVLEPETLPDSEDTESLSLTWEGNDLRKAFIMQEILRRPCERTRT